MPRSFEDRVISIAGGLVSALSNQPFPPDKWAPWKNRRAFTKRELLEFIQASWSRASMREIDAVVQQLLCEGVVRAQGDTLVNLRCKKAREPSRADYKSAKEVRKERKAGKCLRCGRFCQNVNRHGPEFHPADKCKDAQKSDIVFSVMSR